MLEIEMKQYYIRQKSFFEFAGSMMIILRKHMHQKNHTPVSRATITRDLLCNNVIYWRIRMKYQIEIIVRICTLCGLLIWHPGKIVKHNPTT